MIQHLSIRNLALIDAVDLSFHPGFNAFTGETGAGKSILLDGIGLLLGQRGNTDFIRSGADSAFVEASFSLQDHLKEQVARILLEWGFQEDDELLVSREITRGGRSTCRVNGRLVTVQMLRSLGSELVQQHGQQEQQGLLKNEEQLRALDLFADTYGMVAQIRRKFFNWRDCQNRLQSTHLDEQERVRRLDMLNFQIEDIQQAHLQPGEEEQLRELKARFAHTDKILRGIAAAHQYLGGVGSQMGATDALSQALREISVAAEYDPTLLETVQLLETAQVHADEANRALWEYLDFTEQDSGQQESTETRLAEIHQMQRKYGLSIQNVLDYLEQAIAERDQLLSMEEQTAQFTLELVNAETELDESCRKLHELRKVAAQRFAHAVEDNLHKLDMPSARFVILVNTRQDVQGRFMYSESGFDTVDFLFSANPGEPIKPLQKVVSGGELSRTMLAIKVAMANSDDMETLIFDEIDSGVGGRALEAIARQMVVLSRTHQVLCVTHSAQIAAGANQHFLVNKVEQQNITTTNIQTLSDSTRVEEIARLLSGTVDETARIHAQSLLDRYG
ncbi:DNA repair protein RecN [Alicyclobacillaceae bacterium I2511]|nr:DNA repair protein RecN [Alicyclobacillaceae bacterium I2511]